MKYIDIHSHLNLSPLLEKQEEVISRMKEREVGTITIGTDYETSKLAIESAEKYPDTVLGATVGLHPADTEISVVPSESEGQEDRWAEFKKLANHPKVVAIGECGVDYFRKNDEDTKIRQKDIFKQHIEIAKAVGKPLMIHARPSKGSMDAYEDVLDILEGSGLKANFHFFVGNVDIAKRAVEMGFTMSFDGPITFSEDYNEVIKFLPIESIMAETDAPFAAPAPHRGKVCEPWMVEEVYGAIARIKGMDIEDVKNKINENMRRFFYFDF